MPRPVGLRFSLGDSSELFLGVGSIRRLLFFRNGGLHWFFFGLARLTPAVWAFGAPGEEYTHVSIPNGNLKEERCVLRMVPLHSITGEG